MHILTKEISNFSVFLLWANKHVKFVAPHPGWSSFYLPIKMSFNISANHSTTLLLLSTGTQSLNIHEVAKSVMATISRIYRIYPLHRRKLSEFFLIFHQHIFSLIYHVHRSSSHHTIFYWHFSISSSKNFTASSDSSSQFRVGKYLNEVWSHASLFCASINYIFQSHLSHHVAYRTMTGFESSVERDPLQLMPK